MVQRALSPFICERQYHFHCGPVVEISFIQTASLLLQGTRVHQMRSRRIPELQASFQEEQIQKQGSGRLATKHSKLS
jgi:hypothetical protein